MKQIIIFLLVIILAAIVYGQYKKYKRFSLTEYEYTIPENIDVNYHDHGHVLDYFEAVEELNGYLIMQWSANGIDVRNPANDDTKTTAAVSQYNDKMGKVKYYEAILEKSSELKSKGLSNEEIIAAETNKMSMEDRQKAQTKSLLKKLFEQNGVSNLRIGNNGASVFELQKLLAGKGYDIPADGIFKQATFDALRNFESQQNLYPDGQLDVLTLSKLLE